MGLTITDKGKRARAGETQWTKWNPNPTVESASQKEQSFQNYQTNMAAWRDNDGQGYRSQQLSPNGDQQLSGQEGWDYFGNENFGPGPAGELKKSWARITKPGDVSDRPLLDDFAKDWTELMIAGQEAHKKRGFSLGFGIFSGTFDPSATITWLSKTIENLTNLFGNLKESEEGGFSKTNLINLPGRFAGEAVRLIIKSFEAPVKATKFAVGGLSESINAITETSPIPKDPILDAEINKIIPGDIQEKYPILLDVAAAAQGIAKLSPNVLFNKALQIPLSGKPLEEMIDIAQHEFIGARIYFSGFADETAQEDFIRRVEAGEDAQLVAQEYERPIAEALGEFPLDPLNVLGLGAAKTANVRRWGNVADDFTRYSDEVVEISDEIAALGKGLDNGQAADLLVREAQAQIKASANTAENISNLAKDTGARALVTSGKRWHLGRRSEIVVGHIVANSDSIEETNEAMYAIYLMASGKEEQVLVGLDIARNWKKSRPLMLRGEAHNELGKFLQNTIEDNPNKFLNELNAVVRKANDDLAKFASAAADEVSDVTRAVTKVPDAQKKLLDEFAKLHKAGDVLENVPVNHAQDFLTRIGQTGPDALRGFDGDIQKAAQAVADDLGVSVDDVVNAVFDDALGLSAADDAVDAARAQRTLNGARDLKQPLTPEELLHAHLVKETNKGIANMIPTLNERINAGEEVSGALRAIAKFDNIVGKGLWQPANRFFAAIYMGMSPGYAFRNLLTNTIHIFVDEGAQVFNRSPRSWLDLGTDWLGGKIPKAEGFGPVRALPGVGASNSKIWNTFLRLSERFEKSAARMVVGSSINRTMRKMMVPGRAIPDIRPLLDAGMSRQSALYVQELLLRTKGNTRQAERLFREAVKTGSTDLFRSLHSGWVDPDDLKWLGDMGLTDEMEEMLSTVENFEEAQAAMGKTLQRFRDEAAKVENEAGAVSNSGQFVEDAAELGRARQAGHVTDQQVALSQSRYTASDNALDGYLEAAKELQTAALRAVEKGLKVSGTRAAAEKRLSAINQVMNDAFNGIFGDVQGVARRARQQEWKNIRKVSDEIRNMPANSNWAEQWRLLDIPGSAPADLTKKTLQNAWWEDGFTRIDVMAQDTRNGLGVAVEGYAISLEVASGAELTQLKSLNRARQSYKASQRFDNAIITKDQRMMSFAINGQPFPLSETEGIFNTRHLLNAINKWLPEGTPKFKSLFDIPNRNIARMAIRRRAVDRVNRMLASSEPLTIEKLVQSGFSPEAASRVLSAKSAPGFSILQEGSGNDTILRFLIKDVEGRMLPSTPNRPALLTRTDVAKGARRQGLGSEAVRARLQYIVDSGETKFLTNAQTDEGAALYKALEEKGWIKRLDDFPTAAQKEPYTQYEILSDLPRSSIISLTDDAVTEIAKIADDVADTMRESYFKLAKQGGETIPDKQIIKTFDNWLDRIRDHKMTEKELAQYGSKEKWATSFLDAPTSGTLDDMADILGMEREDIITLLLEKSDINILKPQLAYGQFPSHARAIDENMAGTEALFKRLNDGIEGIWGQSADIGGVGNEVVFKAYLDDAAGRIAEARLMADGVSQAARDFTLLAYPAKTNIDLAMAYIYPYQFWYSRTYAHWLQRMTRQPYLISGYSRYRSTLEKIHAGAPNWWKYNINSGETLGLFKDNPLFFNLESTINPLNGLTGIDFNDRDKATGWATNLLQELGKFGPSTFSGFSIATAVALKMRGEELAASKWGGRLIPQTASIRSVAALFGADLEVDPSIHFFSGGIGPYERRRVGRTLAGMGDNDLYSEAEIIDAGFRQSGPIWDEAVLRQSQTRAPGQLFSATLGIGFRPRTQTDLAIDAFDQAYRRFWAMSDDMSPTEIRNGLNALRQKYPFMDTVLLSRKGGLDRDRAFAYNVLSRIPPAQSDDFAKLVGIDPRLLSRFFEGKGHLEEWPDSDREKFMAGMLDLSVVLDMPPQVTKNEWVAARGAYDALLNEQKRLFRDNIRDQIDAYFASFDDTQSGRDRANQMLKLNPMLESAMDWQDQTVINSTLLASYYANLQKVQKYYNGLMFDAIEKELGEDIWDKWSIYWALEGVSKKAQRDYWKANPELARYGDLKDVWQPLATQHAIRVGRLLPEGIGASQREMEGELGLGAQDVSANFPQVSRGRVTLEQWNEALGGPAFNLVMDFLLDEENMPPSVETKLDALAQSMGLGDASSLIAAISTSLPN